jgi:hypothetical protein
MSEGEWLVTLADLDELTHAQVRGLIEWSSSRTLRGEAGPFGPLMITGPTTARRIGESLAVDTDFPPIVNMASTLDGVLVSAQELGANACSVQRALMADELQPNPPARPAILYH